MRRAMLIALILVGISGGARRADSRDFRTYTVQDGDTCWNIALRIFGKGERYNIIHRYNRLGPLPHLLKPGQELRLPLSGSAPDAKIAWLQQDVQTKAPRSLDWRRARPDMGLWRLYKVVTGASSSAGIVFEDHSRLKMRENALLVIYGRGAATVRRKRLPTSIKVEEGTVLGGLARLDRGQRLTVKTPSSDLTLRSRSAQISVDKQQSTSISVYDGQVDVRAAGGKAVVSKGHGTVVHKGRRPQPPQRLPRAPSWLHQGEVVIPVPQGHLGEFEARWRGLPFAARYRIELAMDAKFRFPLADAVVGAGILRFKGKQLKPGRYYARVSSIDKNRLEGPPSPVLRVRLLSVRTSRRVVREPHSDPPVFETTGLLRLSFALPKGAEVALGRGPFRAASTVRLSRTGDYEIRFRAGPGAQEETLRLRLAQVTAALAVDNATSPPRLHVTLRDPKDRPVTLPGLRIVELAGGEIPLTATGAGVFSAVLTPSASTIESWSTEVELRWSGGVLARKRLIFESSRAHLAQPLPAKPRTYSWPDPSLQAEWAPSAFGLPSRAARPSTFIGLSSFITGASHAGRTPLYLRLALRGGLALLNDTLGFDLDLPWYDGDLTKDRPGENALGSIRLGARWWAISIGDLHLAPSLRVSLPSGQQSLDWRPASIEPAVLLDWDLTSWLTLHSNISLSIASDLDLTAVSLGYTIGGAIQIWRGLRGSLELASLYALSYPEELGNPSPLVVAGGVSYDFRRSRIGVVGGVGITEDTHRMIGTFTTGFFYDLLF